MTFRCYRCHAPVSSRGECACKDGCCLIHADCREVLTYLPHVDAVVTDPPYAIPTVVAQGRSVTRNIGDLTIVEAGLRVFFDLIFGRLTPEGRAFIFCDQTSYPILFRLFYGNQMGLLVWNKGRIGMGREFRKSFELILHLWYPDTPLFSDGKGRADVLNIKPVGDERQHPAEKPVDLVKELLAVCGDLILDPFVGSGTTLRAAKDLGRRCIGIEIEEKWVAVAAERLRQGVLL